MPPHHQGTSTGRVADGVIWPDGTATLRWAGDRASTVHWDRIADAKAVHGHGGATRIVLTGNPTDRLGRIADAHSQDRATGGMTSGDCTECGHAWPCPTYAWATTARDPLATWDPADDDADTLA